MIIENKIVIHQKAAVVAKVFLTPENKQFFHDGFQGATLLKGTAGEIGAVTRIYLRQRKRDMKIQESIIKNELPDYFKAFYHHKHMDNNLEVWLKETERGETVFQYRMTYTRFANFLIRWMSKMSKSKFQNHSDDWMLRIKSFAEKTQHNS